MLIFCVVFWFQIIEEEQLQLRKYVNFLLVSELCLLLFCYI